MAIQFSAGSTAQNSIEYLLDNGSYRRTIETKTFAKKLEPKSVSTAVESQQSKGMAESFIKTFKRDYDRLANQFDLQTVINNLK